MPYNLFFIKLNFIRRENDINNEVKLMSELVCQKCGKKVETIPQHCGQDMIFNEETNRWECYMGSECGYMSIEDYLCEDCCGEEE